MVPKWTALNQDIENKTFLNSCLYYRLHFVQLLFNTFLPVIEQKSILATASTAQLVAAFSSRQDAEYFYASLYAGLYHESQVGPQPRDLISFSLLAVYKNHWCLKFYTCLPMFFCTEQTRFCQVSYPCCMPVSLWTKVLNSEYLHLLDS